MASPFMRFALLAFAALVAALAGSASTGIASPGSHAQAVDEVPRVTSRATGEILKSRG